MGNVHEIPVYGLSRSEKDRLMVDELNRLTRHHYDHCEPYRRVVGRLGYHPEREYPVADLPFLPVRLFKKNELRSVARTAVAKTMVSSGTSGQSVSQIFLDQANALDQTKALTRIVSHFLGPKRLPLLVIDSPATVKDRTRFSARGAGILGFSMLGRDITYALTEEMKLDLSTVQSFLEKYRAEPILLFGFTFMVWKHFFRELAALKVPICLESAVLIHGGGWKAMIDEAVDNETFKKSLKRVSGLSRVHNYYGMVEQTGSIFMECEKGFLHSSIYSDILIRRPDFSAASPGEPGLVQLVSVLASSYPGHSLLSEDVGEWLGEDNCACGRSGRYFRIIGRVKNAEARGCSDTYAAR